MKQRKLSPEPVVKETMILHEGMKYPLREVVAIGLCFCFEEIALPVRIDWDPAVFPAPRIPAGKEPGWVIGVPAVSKRFKHIGVVREVIACEYQDNKLRSQIMYKGVVERKLV